MMIQLSILFAGVNISVNQLPDGWKWMYFCNGFAHALRIWFLPQYEGEEGAQILSVASASGFSLTTKQAFAEAQLGLAAGDKWWAFGALMLIAVSAWVLMIIFHVKLNHQKR